MDGQSIIHIGKHQFYCGDFGDNPPLPLFDVCYMDPPWGQANLTTSYNRAGVVNRLPWKSFIVELMCYVSRRASSSSLCFVETSRAYRVDFDFAFETSKLQIIDEVPAIYSKSVYDVVIGKFTDNVRDYVGVSTHLPGKRVARLLISNHVEPGMTFFDPCCGRVPEFTFIARQCGARCVGIEMNRSKLDYLLEGLSS